MKLERETKEYSYRWPQDPLRQARILFEKSQGKNWELGKCDFWGVAICYTLDDWKFLNELSNDILEMYKKNSVPS